MIVPPPDAPVLSTVQVAALAGVSFRRIDYWLRRGLLRSSALPPHYGSGNYRRWTLRDLVAVQAAVARMEWGAVAAVPIVILVVVAVLTRGPER